MQPATFPTLFRGKPKITTHSGQKPPYGYVDWWPISLYVNNEAKPFDDKDVRWALAYKFRTEEGISKIQSIELSIGKYGELTPVKFASAPARAFLYRPFTSRSASTSIAL